MGDRANEQDREDHDAGEHGHDLSYVKILDGASATSLAPRARAFGTIQDVAKASHVDAETVTLNDGYGALVFEYDVTGNGVTAGRVNVDISAATDAASVGVILAAAINASTTKHADGTGFAMTAVHTGTGLVYVWSENFGTVGNKTITETVADVGFTVSGLSGAVNGVSLVRGETPGDPSQGFQLVDETEDVLFVATSRSGTGTMTFSGRLWTYQAIPKIATPNSPLSLPPGVWAPHGIAVAADTDRGLLNNLITVAESFSLSDHLTFQQAVGEIRHASRAYCQVVTLGGTSPVFDAWLKGR